MFSDDLIFPLTSLINKSCTEGSVLSSLKLSKVYALHKKGRMTEINNYRPITLVSTYSKVIAKIVLSRIISNLAVTNLLTEATWFCQTQIIHNSYSWFYRINY